MRTARPGETGPFFEQPLNPNMMSAFFPKPYKQYDRATGTWRTVQPDAIDLAKPRRHAHRAIQSYSSGRTMKSQVKQIFTTHPNKAMSVQDIANMIPDGGNLVTIHWCVRELLKFGLISKTHRAIRNAKNQLCHSYQLKPAKA